MIVTSPPYWGLRQYHGRQELIWTDAWQGGLGLEPTIELYIAHLMEIMAGIHRVLRKDGVAFINLGDSRAANRSYQVPDSKWRDVGNNMAMEVPIGLKPKDLCLIPERFVLACQQAGWWVRDRIAWVKPNPMPESVRDRPTHAWEHIYMLTKSERYWWDQEAVREAISETTEERAKYHWCKGGTKASQYQTLNGLNRDADYPINRAGRNLRNVWTFPTQSLPTFRIDSKKYDHFAAFPEELPRRAILAACPPYICPKCKEPWRRIIEKKIKRYWHECPKDTGYREQSLQSGVSGLHSQYNEKEIKFLGWAPACQCGLPQEDCVPGIVLDPFLGSGTALIAAKKLGRQGIGIDLSEDYCKLSAYRLERTQAAMMPVTEEKK